MSHFPRAVHLHLLVVCAAIAVAPLSGCDSRPKGVSMPTPAGRAEPGKDAAGKALATSVWRSMLGDQPDYCAAAKLLRDAHAESLRRVVYAVPDALDLRASIEDVQINLGVAAMRPSLEGIVACAESGTIAERVQTLIGLDHLLAGAMASAAKTVDATGSAGVSYRNAVLFRRVVLDWLVKLGEPAAAHQPAAKLKLLQEAERERDPDAPIP